MNKALITGITGQDGAYLARFLLKKGYEVHGIKRRSSLLNTERIDNIYHDPHEKGKPFYLHYGDMTDSANLIRLIQVIQPDEIYNLAAMSHVMVSFEMPEYSANVNALGTLRILEAVRLLNLRDKTRIYQASTSELYGKVRDVPQNEGTPFYPRSPYGVSKLYAYWITKNYREAYGLFACNGILFNHESPLRGETFVTRKITRAAVRICFGKQKTLHLGNLNATRDWGHAQDYIEAMWLMLQQPKPQDYVIATGQTCTVRQFVKQTFAKLGIHIAFEGKNNQEIGKIVSVNNPKAKTKTGDIVVKIDNQYFRPTEVQQLQGDAAKARKDLNWTPRYTLDELIEDMVQNDLKQLDKHTSNI